jgi:predicted ATPase
MLRYLHVTNFRAFKQLPLEFSRLNIFVGPNNSGKSSAISAINLIAQNAKRDRRDSGLVLNGPYTDLGSYYDVVYGHKAQSHIKLAFGIDDADYEYQFRYRIQRREIQLSKASIGHAGGKYEYSLTRDGSSHTIVMKKGQRRVDITHMRPRTYGLNFSLPYIPSSTQGEAGREVFATARNLFVRAGMRLDEQFSNFDAIGAFRASPQRTYLYSGEAPNEVGKSGENFAQILANSQSSRDRNSQNTVARVKHWFRGAGIANSVEIRSLTNRHFELCVQDRIGFTSNIVDVGFGCSQVLPVIISGYRLISRPAMSHRRGGIFVVQEPEIHLHPSAAAHLGTFFVDLVRNGVQCFVETHSENIILRVARHIAAGHIEQNDVKVFWVSDNEKERSVTELKFREDGSFEVDWPEGFFPTRASETLQLARSASNFSNDKQLELALQW